MTQVKVPSRCCAAFFLPEYPTVELRDARVRFIEECLQEAPNEKLVMELSELRMVTPLTWEDLPQSIRPSLEEASQSALREGRTVAWTCTHFEPETGCCGIYETRPPMCKTYPTNEDGYSPKSPQILCTACSSTYCSFHPENAR